MGRHLSVCVLTVLVLWGWAWSAPIDSLAQSVTEVANSEQDWQGLPPGKGREETFYLCGPCHSLKLVTQQGLTRDSWEEVMDYMVAEQAMAPLESTDRKLIVDYLAKFYGADRKARGGSLTPR
jgi:hypothetical protein